MSHPTLLTISEPAPQVSQNDIGMGMDSDTTQKGGKMKVGHKNAVNSILSAVDIKDYELACSVMCKSQ